MNARHRLRGRRIDTLDPRMGRAAARKNGMQHVRQNDVVNEARFAAQQSRILDAGHRTADQFAPEFVV